MSGGPRRFRGRGRGAAGRGEQADPAAGAYDEWSAADEGWDLGHGGHQQQGHDGQQQQGGSTSSYFGTNDAAGMTAPAAADGPQATGGEMTGPATNGPTTGMPPGYGDPNANMSPMHMWFGPPEPLRSFGTTWYSTSTWSSSSTWCSTTRSSYADARHSACAWGITSSSLWWMWDALWTLRTADVPWSSTTDATTPGTTTSSSHEQCFCSTTSSSHEQCL